MLMMVEMADNDAVVLTAHLVRILGHPSERVAGIF
jgi:hypothetical protein